jgi:Glycosyl hydrolases family 39
MKSLVTEYSLRLWPMLVVLITVIGLLPATAQDDTLSVDTAQPLGPISPYVYGANYGPPALVSLDLIPQAEASGVTYFRIPAGRWGDDNDLRLDMVDLYYRQVRQWGGELAISTRLPGSGGTPEKAADLVRYTLEQGYDVRYWAIGNEPDLIDAYKNVETLTDFADVRIEDYNRDWRAVAEAMLAVDPDIVLIGPDVSQFPPTVDGDSYTNVRREWVRAFLKANSDLVDIVSIHRYPFPVSMQSITSIEQLRNNVTEWDIIVNNLREVILDATGKDLPIAITEVNSHWSNGGNGEATPDSFYNAVWWADVLGRLIKQKVDIVSYFAFQSAGSLGEFGLLERYDVRPTYFVYQLYQKFGSQLLTSASTDPDLSITAAFRDDGALTLMVVNLASEQKSTTLDLSGFTLSVPAEVWRLDVDHTAEPIESEDLSGNTLTLPPQSVTLYILPAAP